jgi:hypothetical protein
MKTFLTFLISFYLGGVAVVALIGASFGLPTPEAIGEGLLWPFWAFEVIRSMAMQESNFHTL